jgi:F0F1-type ATP synthase membrane subunit b/b'
MPQFDTVTFLSQLFWLTVVFYTFYMVCIRNFLPGLTRILKVRRKKLDLGAAQGSAFEQETLNTNLSYDNMLGQKAGTARDLISDTVQKTTNWTQATAEQINNSGDLKNANTQYLNSSINISGRKILTSAM